MRVIDYHVTAHGKIERGIFYNYMHKLGYKDERYTREQMINSPYPFGVCIKKKRIMIIESATICFLVQKAGNMKTVEEFMQIMCSRKRWYDKFIK